MNITIPESPYGGTVLKEQEFCGLRLVDGIYTANTRVPLHAHEQAVFCIALKGECHESYGGRVRSYEGFTVEFLPANECHALAFPHSDTRAFSIDVAPYWLERAREYSLSLKHSIYSRHGQLSGLMIKVYREFLANDGAALLAIEGLTLEMLAEVSRRRLPSLDRKPPSWLVQAQDLLHTRFCDRISLAELAATVGVHPVHLAREFRRFHHCTIGEYLRRLRIERACQQLRDTKTPLAAIASEAGFSDQSHFSRTFRRLLGMTPAAYRATLSGH